MNPISIILGLIALCYGVFTWWARASHPEYFTKLEAMKKAYGDSKGTTMHVIAYTVVPIVIGVSFLALGIMGFNPLK